jgi:uncharacterized damage-inducible protein DinB
MSEAIPEPWLRGPLADVHPLLQPVFFSFAQVREDLAKHVSSLSVEQVWRKRGGASVGFHLKHLAGSVDRLTTYLAGQQLTDIQLRNLRAEGAGDEDGACLLTIVDESLKASEQRLSALDPQQIYDSRTVGRKKLPTTVIGLLVHLAEHTQRHLGQAITLAKLLRDEA